jgi:hypothetical protein
MEKFTSILRVMAESASPEMTRELFSFCGRRIFRRCMLFSSRRFWNWINVIADGTPSGDSTISEVSAGRIVPMFMKIPAFVFLETT